MDWGQGAKVGYGVGKKGKGVLVVLGCGRKRIALQAANARQRFARARAAQRRDQFLGRAKPVAVLPPREDEALMPLYPACKSSKSVPNVVSARRRNARNGTRRFACGRDRHPGHLAPSERLAPKVVCNPI